jgi:hypothetical protein
MRRAWASWSRSPARRCLASSRHSPVLHPPPVAAANQEGCLSMQ